MINEILHVGSRCGGGKSHETIKELVDFLLQSTSIEDTYLFASKTNNLTEQNFELVESLAKAHPSGRSLPLQRIDSVHNKGTVVRDLIDQLSARFRGVIFISHSTLATIPPEQLNNIRVVVDEVPKELAGCLMVKHSAKDHGHPWVKYLTDVASNHSGYMSVEIHPQTERTEVVRFIEDIRQRRDNTTTNNVADLLEFLLAGYEVVYTTTTNSDGSLTRLYQAIHYHRLKDLAAHVSFLAILSAQLKDTLFGFIATHHLGLPIVERDINDKTTLVQKHRNRVRIIPFLAEGKWSTTLKTKPANTSLLLNGDAVKSTQPVHLLAQEFAGNCLAGRDFLITLNQSEKLIASLDRVGVSKTSTAVHGMNNYRHLDHAAYLASTNPTPFDIKSLRMFSQDRGLDEGGLLKAVMVERCYETAYQCVARTSIRNDKPDPYKEHIIIVPDMHYADYIASWFEPGYATIETHNSYTARSEDERKLKEEHRRAVVVHILSEYSNRTSKLADLINKSGISLSSFKRYKKEFRPELERLNLL